MASVEFKEGDIVRCTDVEGAIQSLQKNVMYRVRSVHDNRATDGSVFLNLYELPAYNFLASRFQLIETTPKEAAPKAKIASDGGSTGYYDIPPGCTTLYDLIEYKDMNFSEGNVFKAIYRLGDKEGIDPLYDWRKIKFCAEREIARLEKEQK